MKKASTHKEKQLKKASTRKEKQVKKVSDRKEKQVKKVLEQKEKRVKAEKAAKTAEWPASWPPLVSIYNVKYKGRAHAQCHTYKTNSRVVSPTLASLTLRCRIQVC